jgi:cation diffusion facilitator CzcD-associated flavoprotein CzcO
MLQRSPSYVLPLPSEDALGNRLRSLLGEERAYKVTRGKNILRQRVFYNLCRRYPRLMRRVIRRINAAHLPENFPVDVHFKPNYDPWDQRLCIVPDADLYKALQGGSASIATGHIETFTESGIRLKTGEELEADIIVTATGLNLQAYGGIDLTVDGKEISLPETVAYKGMMLSGVPNLVFAIGYTNASWTLKIDLVCEYFCRLLGHLDKRGLDVAVPEPADPDMKKQPLLDFEAGYVLRAIDQLPKQGEKEPWFLAQNYFKDARYLRRGEIEDGEMRFFAAGERAVGSSDAALAA